jgi:hypothetical protein
MAVSPSRLQEVVSAAAELVENGVPVLPIRPHSKKPVAGKEETWRTADDPDMAEQILRTAFSECGGLNLGITLGRQKGSPLISIDVDGPSGADKARELGVSSKDDCWVQKTGNAAGNRYQILYYCEPGLKLVRKEGAGDLPLDLLVNGYGLVPPSVTTYPYRWIKGPAQLSVSDLRPPPKPLLDWWEAGAPSEAKAAAKTITKSAGPKHDPAYLLLGAPIYEKTRNSKLAQIAGWLHRYHRQKELEALLLAVNDGRCKPPLSVEEVLGIARSIGKYEVGGTPGYPKAAVLDFVRREGAHE